MNYRYHAHLLWRESGYAVRLQRHDADGVDCKELLVAVGLNHPDALVLIQCVELTFCLLATRP